MEKGEFIEKVQRSLMEHANSLDVDQSILFTHNDEFHLLATKSYLGFMFLKPLENYEREFVPDEYSSALDDAKDDVEKYELYKHVYHKYLNKELEEDDILIYESVHSNIIIIFHVVHDPKEQKRKLIMVRLSSHYTIEIDED